MTKRSTEQLHAGLDHVRDAPIGRGRLEMIVRRPAVDERQVVDSAELDRTVGLVGDTWARRPSRRTADGSPHPHMQVTLMNARAVALIAGSRANWPLAGYAFKELRQGFLVTARAIPRWRGLPVPDLFDAALSQPLAQLDFAIKANEPHQFAEAYARLTAGCNACHATTDHSFIVIKAPDGGAAAFPNQDFQPKR